MTIKSILCVFAGSQNELNAVNTTLILGKIYGAHIRFLHVSPSPGSYAGLYGEGIMASASIVEAIEKENEALLQKARQYVVSFTAKHHVPLDVPTSPAHHTSAHFVHRVGYLEHFITREGRLSDLIVIGRGISEPNSLYDAVMSALFDTGRPVLLMPVAKGAMPTQWEDKVVTLAWDGSLEASRALLNALPLIEKAENLQVLVAREHSKAFDLEAERGIMEYLLAHGFHPNVIVTDREHHAVGETLLTRAKELKSNLMVMGAYGHSRFREMLLGGVTNYMIEKADIPLLLSH